MDLSQVSPSVFLVLLLVLFGEAANGWTDAPCATSSAVSSGTLTSGTALCLTVFWNFVGLMLALVVGAKVAETIGKGIVRPEVISMASIGIAMLTVVLWSLAALLARAPISKTHSLLASLAGIGVAQGGLQALAPESGKWIDSGWVKVGAGMFIAVFAGFALSWFIARLASVTGLVDRVPRGAWSALQYGTVSAVSIGHGFNDGLKYVGIFTLVLAKAGVIKEFHVYPSIVVLCAIVMALGTMLGGKRIHQRLDSMVNHAGVKKFESYMGVSSELVAAAMIIQTGWIGMPTSTNHATVSTMAGARSAEGKVHTGSIVRILSMWLVTYFFCGGLAWTATQLIM